jgi:hypothetical protein
LWSNRQTILELAAGGIRDPEDGATKLEAAIKGVAEGKSSTEGRQSVQVLGRCQNGYLFAG